MQSTGRPHHRKQEGQNHSPHSEAQRLLLHNRFFWKRLCSWGNQFLLSVLNWGGSRRSNGCVLLFFEALYSHWKEARLCFRSLHLSAKIIFSLFKKYFALMGWILRTTKHFWLLLLSSFSQSGRLTQWPFSLWQNSHQMQMMGGQDSAFPVAKVGGETRLWEVAVTVQRWPRWTFPRCLRYKCLFLMSSNYFSLRRNTWIHWVQIAWW